MASSDEAAIEHIARAMIAKHGLVTAAIIADESAARARLSRMTKTAREMELVAAAIRRFTPPGS